MNKSLIIGLVIVALVAGYFVGDNRGYSRSQSEIKRIQEEAAQKAAEDSAKSSNPFQAANPLKDVEANPFEKVKKIINPFD